MNENEDNDEMFNAAGCGSKSGVHYNTDVSDERKLTGHIRMVQLLTLFTRIRGKFIECTRCPFSVKRRETRTKRNTYKMMIRNERKRKSDKNIMIPSF